MLDSYHEYDVFGATTSRDSQRRSCSASSNMFRFCRGFDVGQGFIRSRRAGGVRFLLSRGVRGIFVVVLAVCVGRIYTTIVHTTKGHGLFVCVESASPASPTFSRFDCDVSHAGCCQTLPKYFLLYVRIAGASQRGLSKLFIAQLPYICVGGSKS